MNEADVKGGSPAGDGAGWLESRVVHDGRVVHLSVDRVRFPDGSVGELELIRHRGASAVVPILDDVDAADPRIVLVRQYRYAAGGFVYEIPAGIPSEGESWEDCARRELEEETGYLARDLFPLTWFFTTPGFTNEVIHLFAATGLVAGTVRRDEDEFMEVVKLPLSRVLELVRTGELRDGKSLVGILFLERFFRGVGAPARGDTPSRR
jgi:ADP-ribose pyrophosphatase